MTSDAFGQPPHQMRDEHMLAPRTRLDQAGTRLLPDSVEGVQSRLYTRGIGEYPGLSGTGHAQIGLAIPGRRACGSVRGCLRCDSRCIANAEHALRLLN